MGSETAKSEGVRKRLLQAAERLFAEKGFRAMTVRDLTKACDLNVAAVNYHFGSKKDLMRAVIEARFGPVNQHRMQLLREAAAAAAPEPIPMRTIIDILVRPLYEMAHVPGKGNRSVVKMMGRCFAEPADFIQEMHDEFFTEISALFYQELLRALPHRTGAEVRLGFFFAVSTLIGAISDEGRLRFVNNSTREAMSMQTMVDGLVNFIVGGLEMSAGHDGDKTRSL